MSPHVLGTPVSAEGEEGKGVGILIRTVDFEQERTRRATASLYDRTRKRWQKNLEKWQNRHEIVANRLR